MIEVNYTCKLHLAINLEFDEKPTREELKRALIENIKDYIDRFSHRDIEDRVTCEPIDTTSGQTDNSGHWPKFES